MSANRDLVDLGSAMRVHVAMRTMRSKMKGRQPPRLETASVCVPDACDVVDARMAVVDNEVGRTPKVLGTFDGAAEPESRKNEPDLAVAEKPVGPRRAEDEEPRALLQNDAAGGTDEPVTESRPTIRRGDDDESDGDSRLPQPKSQVSGVPVAVRPWVEEDMSLIASQAAATPSRAGAAPRVGPFQPKGGHEGRS